MENKTSLNLFSKLKTRLNRDIQEEEAPSLVGKILLNQFLVTDQMKTNSGEANLYKARSYSRTNCVVKQYRRKNAIKTGIIEKLKSHDHPNICKILADGELDGFQYVVMPFYQGVSLEKYIEEGGKFDFDELKHIIIPTLNESLHAIHQLGVIHKDLKPANIIVTEADSNLVLIDFGISTETDDRTIIVTQTGRTPFYSAPETNSGAFSIYSDYYSLGITIYELFTGYTPFQANALNHDDVALYAQMQKIPYPEDFPKELRDLIDGLTYKDLSNRNDLNNPNRRWTYNEVVKWLNGEKQPVPGSGLQVSAKPDGSDFEVPYFMNGKRLYTKAELGHELLSNWKNGIKELGRGLVTRHFEQNNDAKARVLCEEAEQKLIEPNADTLAILYRLVYTIIPNLKTFYYKDYKFESLKDYADALINEVVTNKSQDKDFVESAKELLTSGVLASYVENQTEEPLRSALITLVKNNTTMIAMVPIDADHQALRLAYSLTNREDFKIGDQSFKNIDEYNESLEKLYDQDIVKFINFFKVYEKDIEAQAKLFVGEAKQRFDKNLAKIKDTIILGNGAYIFKRPIDVLNYQNQLWNENKLIKLNEFVEITKDEMGKIKEQIKVSNEQQFEDLLQKYNSMINIDEYFFKNIEDFINYANKLKKLKTPILAKFIKTHKTSLSHLANNNPKFKPVLLDLIDDYMRTSQANAQHHDEHLAIDKSDMLLKDDFIVGNYVKFGKYYNISTSKKEPLEWQVLKLEGNQALLITRFGVDCKAYNNTRMSITWEDCDLRKWCNKEFLNEAFIDNEKDRIITSHLSNNAGGETDDKIFLLSVEEAEACFKSEIERMCKPTLYLRHKGAYVNENDRNCFWWLRSRGSLSFYAAVVCSDGIINDFAITVDNATNVVRPALWIKL